MNLTDADLQVFACLRIPGELIEAARIQRVSDTEAREVFGFQHAGDLAGIAFPYFLPMNGKHRATARLRRDHPEIENGNPKNKYISAYGDTRHLYFPPGARELLADKATDVVFVEAEKSALALLAWSERIGRKLLPIATGGCWGWRGRIGKATDESGTRVDEMGPLPDLDCARGRGVYILFDSNAATNPKVRAAQREFAQELRKLGAILRILDLPAGDWNGPDDYLAAKNDDEMSAIFEKGGKGSSSAKVVGKIPDEEIATATANVTLPDMPETVLDGRLGEIYQRRLSDFPIAYGWPSLLAAASALINRQEHRTIPANLYVALVGPAHSGKSSAIERANFLLDVKDPVLKETKSGSAEGLLADIGDQQGQGVLLFPDELSHLLEKVQITNASFAYILNSLFYKERQNLTIAHGRSVSFNCRLSVVGGIVDEKFDESFGSATTTGLYDRFLFAQCPSGFDFLWRPLKGAPAVVETFDEVPVDRDVWEARDHVVKAEKLNPRLLEIALRTAAICAAVDGRERLQAADLSPTWELARYQSRVRTLLQPNPGKNFEARFALKLLAYLNRHAPDGQWVSYRKALKDVRAYDVGPSIVERAINAMRFGRVVEVMEPSASKGQKQRLLRFIGGASESD